MKKLFILLCFSLFIPWACFAQQPKPNQKYLVQLPIGYNENIKYPLFVAILWYDGTAQQQVNEWKFYANKEKYILLCPQFNEGYQQFRGREDKKLIEIIEEVEKKFSIDQGNIFLVGFSGGAQFVHRFAFKHPGYLKAACIMSAGDYDVPPDSLEAKKIKYFVAVGEEDERFKATEHFYQQLKNKGYDAVFESVPMAGHTMSSNFKGRVIAFLRKQIK